ncbi:hybrid sensor histidine kinase/response regulator [Aliterella atlantica]|uniref:Circadian input-output histidine kinase CikA n=2 Tax=Aliterella TaxID=1827277 RepID=A0A0D8ZSV3_9CYAN|nr:hybrid sensor histidine kinase/response regulator [Aliterella atlantica]KJH71442.1 histidine kinase [Aliterella atlantica CENA595]
MHGNQHLTSKVASLFLLLSLIAIGVVGGVAFYRAREALKQAAYNQLSVAATLKEEEITRWFQDRQQDFFAIAKFPAQRQIDKILQAQSASKRNLATHQIANYLIDITQTKPDFQEIFILDRSNKVILSTNKQHEGQYEILADTTYIEKIEQGKTFAPIFYVSPNTGKPAVTLATPIRDAAGVRQGLILAHLNLDRIDRIVRERTGLGKSGETYLVGSLVVKNTFISKADRTDMQAFSMGVSSQGIDTAISGVSGFGLYQNYANVPVIGVYRWLNAQDLALLVEMQQAEAFTPARQLAGTIVLVGLVSVGVLSIGVYWLAQQLQLSRAQLENYSHKLEQKAQEALAANHAKSAFLANMSHELRTPLSAILGFTQLMTRDPALSAAQLENLATISRSGEHLLTLINDVLSMSKIEAGRITLDETNFNLYNLLDALAEMFEIKAEAKGLELIFQRALDVPTYVRADESKLRQVLINLLGNAIKFTATGRVILRVSVISDRQEQSSEGLTLHFEVEDTGMGIAPSELERLFKPFVQTQAGLQSHQGTGLGLSISQQFARLMHGEIALRSTPGQGTIFSFDVPVNRAQIIEESETRVRQRAIALAPDQPIYRILVVEDKSENRQLLVKFLTSIGFAVRAAENGQVGVSIWQTWEPHLIWMDMRMPVMDGYEATRQIKSQAKGKNTIVIALTASAFDEERALVLSSGCDDFVCKPFLEEVILEKMAKYLGVRYLYADSQPTVKSTEYALKVESLSVMPQQWIEELHQAALRTDEKQIFSLLQQIPSANAPLADGLAEAVNSFRIDKIIDLTQPGSP